MVKTFGDRQRSKEQANREKRTRKFEVSLVMPVGATLKDMEEHIRDAIRIECGHLDCDNPIAELDRSSVVVKAVKQSKKKEVD